MRLFQGIHVWRELQLSLKETLKKKTVKPSKLFNWFIINSFQPSAFFVNENNVANVTTLS